MNFVRLKKDLMLVTFFRKNCRENLTTISRATRMPVSTIFDKLKEFEKDLVSKHTTIVDFKKLGFDIKLSILFKIGKNSKEDFRKFLITNENVNTVLRINNGYDYMVEAIFRNMSGLQKFYEHMDKFEIEEKKELFIIEDVLREAFLSDQDHTGLLLSEYY